MLMSSFSVLSFLLRLEAEGFDLSRFRSEGACLLQHGTNAASLIATCSSSSIHMYANFR